MTQTEARLARLVRSVMSKSKWQTTATVARRARLTRDEVFAGVAASRDYPSTAFPPIITDQYRGRYKFVSTDAEWTAYESMRLSNRMTRLRRDILSARQVAQMHPSKANSALLDIDERELRALKAVLRNNPHLDVEVPSY